MPKETKATNVQLEERVAIVFEALTKGVSTTEMLQYVAAKHDWKVNGRQVYNYIQKANEKFKKLADKKKDVEFGKAITRLSMLFEKSLKIQDFKTCLSIQKEINTMFGNHESSKVDLTTNGKDLNKTINITYNDKPIDLSK
jgi:hypothetical protein